ncbi:MAG: hypothetical protein ACJA1A_003396 [Saprospiraceae bacterium]|jgi:hypothetical protein
MEELGIEVKMPDVAFGKIMEGVDQIVQGIYAHETPLIAHKSLIDCENSKTKQAMMKIKRGLKYFIDNLNPILIFE